MDIPNEKPQQLSRGPRTRVCYICGRQYGLSSYEIHLKQCKELWIARENLKDPKERKPLPLDPLIGALGKSGKMASLSSMPMGDEPTGLSALDLEEINKLASSAFNSVALDTCKFCGRTFLPEKLVIHNRSCTADKPARKVSDSVNRR